MNNNIQRRDMLALGLSLLGTHAAAQAPGRACTIVNAQPAGNPLDVLARKLVPALQKELGQAVVVDNLPGASGSIGVNKVLAAAPDGNTLLIASQSETILTPLALAGVRYKPEDLRCVAYFARAPYALVGRPGLPAKDLTELTALARSAQAKPLSYGHNGYGSMIHLVGEQWSRQGRLSLNPIPYKGVPPLLQDLMGGQIDLTFLPLAGSIFGLIETGKVQMYGVAAPVPNSKAPQVLPLSKLDPALADFNYGAWGALFVSSRTPDAAVRQLHKTLAVAILSPELNSYQESIGADRTEAWPLDKLDQFYRAEIKVYQDLARRIDLLPQ